MRPTDAALADYEAIAERTGRMLCAAQRGDWDALIEEECGCRDIIARLRGQSDAPLTQAGRARKQLLLRRMLADDALIRNLAQPRLEHLENLLCASGNAQKLEGSYGRQP